MLRIRSRGDGGFLLSDQRDRPVAWVRDRTIHFLDFESYGDAIAAAVHGGNALAAYLCDTGVLGRESDARPPDGPGGSRTRPTLVLRDVRLTHDGVHEWVSVGGRQVARVVPPNATHAAPCPGPRSLDRSCVVEPMACGVGGYAIEFVMAHGLGPDACLAIAQVLARAVAHHQPTPRCVPREFASPRSIVPGAMRRRADAPGIAPPSPV
jgi:hypothetical protein